MHALLLRDDLFDLMHVGLAMGIIYDRAIQAVYIKVVGTKETPLSSFLTTYNIKEECIITIIHSLFYIYIY